MYRIFKCKVSKIFRENIVIIPQKRVEKCRFGGL